MILHRLLSRMGRQFSRNKLSILNFHQVLDKPDPMRPWEPDAAKFDWQMGLLRRYFTPLPLLQALDLTLRDQLPVNAVCVTLDDGYLNNLRVALPVLKKHSIPATVFVASAFSEGTNMWNDRIIDLLAKSTANLIDLRPAGLGLEPIDGIESRRSLANQTIAQLKYLPVENRLAKVDELFSLNGPVNETRKMMNPQEIATISRSGVEIGAHTHNHPILKGLSDEQLVEEVSTNRNLLETWTGRPVKGFAYPNGRFGRDMDNSTLRVIKQLNFHYAVSTDAGYTTRSSDLMALPRFTPWDQSALKFHARLLLNLRGRTY